MSRITETEAEGQDSGSHYRVQGVTGDAARVLAISNDAHVAAFPPAGPPTKKNTQSFNKKNVSYCCWGDVAHVRSLATTVTVCRVFPNLFLMSQ